MYNPYDYYFKKAKTHGYKARSAFKIEEIDKRYKIFDKNTKNVLDIGCSPGSWMQFAYKRLSTLNIEDFKVVGFDIKDTNLNFPGVYAYNQDITDKESVYSIINELGIEQFDLIMSDMAPNTIGKKDIDAMKSISLIRQSLYLYKEFLKEDGKFVIKLFMGPEFEELFQEIKDIFGKKRIKMFKPDASRKGSKESYIIKY